MSTYHNLCSPAHRQVFLILLRRKNLFWYIRIYFSIFEYISTKSTVRLPSGAKNCTGNFARQLGLQSDDEHLRKNYLLKGFKVLVNIRLKCKLVTLPQFLDTIPSKGRSWTIFDNIINFLPKDQRAARLW